MLEFMELMNKVSEWSKDINHPSTIALMKKGMTFPEIKEQVKLMREKLLRKGFIFPENDEELEIWTEEFEGYEHNLPESLVDPKKILDRIKEEGKL